MVSAFRLASAFVPGLIHVSWSTPSRNAATMFFTIASTLAFDEAGKYFLMYSWPMASPSAMSVAANARFQRSRCSVVPCSWVP